MLVFNPAGYFQTASDRLTAVATVYAPVGYHEASGQPTAIALVASKGLQAPDAVYVQHLRATGAPVIEDDNVGDVDDAGTKGQPVSRGSE